MHIAVDSRGRLAHISEVTRGATCECRCLSCNDEVVAKQGSLREWHFAHAADRPPCEINAESFLHRFVKQTIEEVRGLIAPPAPDGTTIPLPIAARGEGGWLRFERIECEVAVGTLRADLVGIVGADRVAIEVAYSSFCDEDKIRTFEKERVCALEIDVQGFDPIRFDPDAVRHSILTSLEIKRWLWTEPVVQPTVEQIGEHEIPTIREVGRFLVAGRVVRLSVLRWGQIVIAYEYGPEVSILIRRLAHRYHGQWDGRYKNWRLNGCWLQEVVVALQVLHDPNSFPS